MKQMGLATMQYAQDYDDKLYPHRFNSGTDSNPLLSQPNGSLITNTARNITPWIALLQPYIKSFQVFQCPSNPNSWTVANTDGAACSAPGCNGVGYGGQNSYGHNDAWLSPAGAFNTTSGSPFVVSMGQVERAASTVAIVDATYYGAVPDVFNQSGLQNTYGGAYDPTNDQAFLTAEGGQYKDYWKNIGNGKWSWSGGTMTPDQAKLVGPERHMGFVNCQFVDGHVKSIKYEKAVGDICLWAVDYSVGGTTTYTGSHPFCGS